MSDFPPTAHPAPAPPAETAAATDPRRARFEQVHARVHDDLWRYCIRRVWPAEDAEDLMAEVLAVVWRRLDDVPDELGERPWIFAVARNHVRDRRRQSARRERIFQIAAAAEERAADQARTRTPEDALAAQEQALALRLAFSRLGDDDAEVLRLAVWEKLPHREIARLVNCREGAVAVRLHRARRRLRRQLEALEQLAPTAQHPPTTTLRTTGDDTPAPGPRPTDTRRDPAHRTDQPGDLR